VLRNADLGAIRRAVSLLSAPAAIAVCSGQITAQSQAPAHKNVVYAVVDGRKLLLDIYLPVGVTNPPLVVWIHGGAWSRGTKDQVPTMFVENGFATVSLDFRLSTEARFPAQVHDIKAAIRFLRGEQAQYGFRADRLTIAGSSSGGHLAALVGVTNGVESMEGTIGNHRNQCSNVQAILSYYGAANLTTILSQSTPHGLSVRQPALQLLLGGQPAQVPDLARLASPVFHVDNGDPPLLLLHGDQDPQMPINQSHELEGAYRRNGIQVYLDVVHGAAHGGDAFYTGDHALRAIQFLTQATSNQTEGRERQRPNNACS
jgi:acetyl esterase/lipase